MTHNIRQIPTTDIHLNEDISNLPKSSRTIRRIGFVVLTLLLILFIGAGFRAYSKTQADKLLATSTAENSIRSVQTVQARPGEPKRNLTLSGTLKGHQEAPIYARTNGYIQAWHKGIGESVKKGDLLAVIDAPESEQELQQARANSEQIHSRLDLAQSTLQRWEGLRQRDAVSQQELDERRAAVQQARADLSAAEANVKRLQQLQEFRRVTAPFSGVIVRRNIEVGALIGAGNNGANRELFYISQIDPLRIDIAVPQNYSSAINVGQEVNVQLLERPGATYKGSVVRTAGAIDSATRSMQIEVSLPNPDGKLLPGSYVEVNLPLTNPGKNLLIPVAALQFRQDGPRVAIVNGEAQGEQRIAMHQVKLGRDLGRFVEVLNGVTPKDQIVLNPHDAIEENELVHAHAAPPDKVVDKPSDKPQKSANQTNPQSANTPGASRSDKAGV